MKDEIIIPDKIEYSNRKSIAIIIESDGRLIIRAPKRTPKKAILEICKHKKEWIRERKKRVISKMPVKKRYINGESFLFLGKEHILEIENNHIINEEFSLFNQSSVKNEIYLKLSDGKLKTNTSNPLILEDLFIQFYRKNAKKMLTNKTFKIAEMLKLKINRVNITNPTKRWGSCSSSGNISLSWRLIMAPEEVIKYVIIHELAHLVYMNHSKAFWNLVESYMPNWKEQYNWLKDNGNMLLFAI